MRNYILFIILFIQFPILSQQPLDSLIYYFKKGDDHKIIFHGDLARLEFEKAGLSETDGYLAIMDGIASSYVNTQNYKEASLILHKVTEVRIKRGLSNTKNQARTFQLLARLYTKQFNFKKAEEIFIKIDTIAKKGNLYDTSLYAYNLRLRALNFKKSDSLVKAKNLFEKSIKTYNKIPDKYDEDIINTYLDLIDLLTSTESYFKAKTLISKVEEICVNKKELNRYYFESLDRLSEILIKQNNIEQALKVLKRSIHLKKDQYGADFESLIWSYGALSEIHILQKNYEKAEENLLEKLRLIELNYGRKHSNYYTNLLRIGAFYNQEYPNKKKSDQFLLNFSKQFKERLENVTAYYTNEEMDIYINNNFFLRYFPISFIHSANQQFPKINLEIFKIESLFKKFKIRNSQLTKRIIESGKNDKLKKKYANYIEIKKKYEENSKLKRHSNVLKSLENKIEAFERELATKTFNNKRLILFNENLFQEIKEKLNEDDVIVDLLNYYYFDNESGEKSRGVMDALIIKKEYEFPKFIKLFDNSNFDSLYSKSKGDINRISKLYNDVKMSDLFLSPLTNEFEKEKYIYISLSGISSKINFNALLINDFQTLGEKYQVHLIGSSYDFLTSQESYFNEFESIDLLLYGDIDYDNIELNEVATFRGSSNNKLYPMRAQSNVLKWSYLPGSDKEVNEIKVSSDSYGFKSQIIKGNKATKSSILLLDGKKDNYILHLATHGFFFEGFKKEPTISNGLTDIDPMLRAGLVFAGVNKYWGEPIDSSVLDDGILTAKEISNLDLNSCQLVVLSACETGLGEINGSEGVYGLQRAFKMAGVKNVIMSLWKVPDAQTAELFGLFYEGCFKGLSIHESLRVAQSKMKEKYSPYYWAGFILLE